MSAKTASILTRLKGDDVLAEEKDGIKKVNSLFAAPISSARAEAADCFSPPDFYDGWASETPAARRRSRALGPL